MRPELQATSFISAVALVLLVLAQRKAFTFATTALVSWLFAVNLIHGVNALIWAHDIHAHSDVWCDIVTKLTLGATFAIPASLLCILLRLKNISASPDKYTLDTTSKSRRPHASDAIFCIILPICFMAAHCIVQDRRFVIIEDMGCVPAIYPSAVSVVIVWLPSLFVTIASLGLLGIAAYNTYRRRYILRSGLDRSLMTSSSYHRLLVFSGPMSILVFLFAVFMTATAGAEGLAPWTSWADVHSRMGEVDLRRTEEMVLLEQTRLEMEWWMTPVLTFFALALLGFGKGTRAGNEELFECTIGRLARLVRREPSRSLPTHRAHHLGPSSSLSSRTRLTASQSGWDGTFDVKSSSSPTFLSFPRPPPTAKPYALKVDIPSFLSRPMNGDHAQASKHSDDEASPEDVSFAASTLEYIGSPTGRRALGCVPSTPILVPPTPLPPSSPSPSPTPYSTGRPISYISARPISHLSGYGPASALAPRKESDGALSTVSALSMSDSILAPAKWPEPPRTVLAHPYASAAPLAPGAARAAEPVGARQLGLPAGVFDGPGAMQDGAVRERAIRDVSKPAKAATSKKSFRYPRMERPERPERDGIHMTIVKEVL